ncbi:MAG: hypothetical protein CFH21_00431 [Alphaproteobacteria bacterium MarineAlpha5_Bin11]|nr:hypothetical protein [Pelagibacteraceae bacterium]PPR44213.1 MAG: hypothetical protein CFH21_00431 [Alphaproteobacteria bacterium MarineAlpha5_Bin11]PPR51652.1 MAG: hypothetical protein CFH20_00437 [Alphaproteobacteria bacterium MarineAlpha5_Bin10]|tara:strand:- start:60 stop:674 length:615 start_codon:yes stop_codon:yes gene_type:complete
MRKVLLYFISLFIIFNTQYANANKDNAKNWLNNEIKKIIDMYRNDDIDTITKLDAIESAINNSFAGTGIARYVAGEAWKISSKELQDEFVILFKEHLYLTIGSLMQGYSNQEYELTDSRNDKNEGVYLIDMEIRQNDQKTMVTWRIKESKTRFYVIDLIVADISLVYTKKDEFKSLLKKVDNNLAELNMLLKKQNIESYNNLVN